MIRIGEGLLPDPIKAYYKDRDTEGEDYYYVVKPGWYERWVYINIYCLIYHYNSADTYFREQRENLL